MLIMQNYIFKIHNQKLKKERNKYYKVLRFIIITKSIYTNLANDLRAKNPFSALILRIYFNNFQRFQVIIDKVIKRSWRD